MTDADGLLMAETYAYVGCDPEQPGTACAMADDAPEYKKYTARNLRDWVAAGLVIRRVTLDEGMEMLKKWARPCPKQS